MHDVTVKIRFCAGSPRKKRREIIKAIEGLGFSRVGNSLIWKLKAERCEVAVSLDSFLGGDAEDG